LTAAGVLAALATVATAGLAALQALWPRFDVTGTTLARGARGRREVALTFDDGPSPDTQAVLHALDHAGVKATFFVLGRAAAERPDDIREMARRGHLVALHGWSHRKLLFASPRSVAEEIDRGRQAVAAAGVEPAPYFRAPHGLKGPFLLSALRRRNLALVAWTRGVWDSDQPGAAAIARRACRRMHPGAILLLHDGCGTPGVDPHRDQTAAAVLEIVRRWREAGYRFVRIDEMEAAADGRVRLRLRAVRAIGLALLVGLGVLAARNVDLSALRANLASARWPVLGLAALANLSAIAAQAGRWWALVRPIAPATRGREAFTALVAGFAVALFMPARAGDLARVQVLSTRNKASRAALLGTVALDHVMGGLTLLLFLAAAAAVAPLPPWARRGAATLVGLAGAGALIVWVLWIFRPSRPAALRRGPWGLMARLQHGLAATGEPRALLAAVLFGLGGWVCELLVAAIALSAFDLPVTFQAALLSVLSASLASLVAVSPGNTGTFELAVVLALGGIGVPRAEALAFALGYHLTHLALVAIVGGASLIAAGYKAGGARALP
jgi:peptidoglycan/xylan/chitin deacetylase (PgdA/CDA1 family)/uncharacterized membrane protein YbhN (UPF0104 family)